MHGRRIRSDDQRVRPDLLHHPQADERLPRAAWQHNDAAAAARRSSGMEGTDRIMLVGPQCERFAGAGGNAQRLGEGIAGDVAGHVLHREPDLD